MHKVLTPNASKVSVNHFKWLWLGLIVLIVDQLSKYWAEHILKTDIVKIFSWFDFSLAHNTGAAFSFLADQGGWQQVFFFSLAIIISVILLFMIRGLKPNERHLAIAYSLIISGALGNAIDRAIYQYVIDFVHWFYLECNVLGRKDCHYPHFNVADVAIFFGAGLLIFEAFGKPFLNSKRDEKDVSINEREIKKI